jgi:hypothetical protein
VMPTDYKKALQRLAEEKKAPQPPKGELEKELSNF